MPIDRRTVEKQLEALGDFHRFFTSREIHYLPAILTEDETIHGITSGFYESRTWIIVITNMRLIFLDKGMFYGLKQVDMPLKQISSISYKTGFFLGEIDVATASGHKSIGSVTKKDIIKIVSILSTLIHGKPSSQSTLSKPREDFVSLIERLSSLREKGALTEEEFTLSKAKLLGSLPEKTAMFENQKS